MTGRRGVEAAAAAAAVLAFVHWFVQGSADWFWEFPALGGAAFAMLGLACASARPAGAARRGSPATARIVVATLAGAGLGVAAVSLVFPWLAAIEVHRAQSSWAVSPPAAYRQLELAEDLNPLSPQAAVTSGTIALRVGDTNRAVRAFRRALDREPRNAYAVLELGAIASARGERPQALSLLRRAAALNPQDFITQGALDAVRAGKRVDVGAMNQQMVDQARDLLR
jgi:tetratricopeptide (TPR) repeat protein